MDSKLTTIQNYTVQPVMLPILPTSGPYLADPFNITATYSTSTAQLTILMSFMIPGNVSPSSVSIKQFFTADNATNLDFYAVYSSESTSNMKQVDCKFKASAVDAGGLPITLNAVNTVANMVVCSAGPKTSRKTSTNVMITESHHTKEHIPHKS